MAERAAKPAIFAAVPDILTDDDDLDRGQVPASRLEMPKQRPYDGGHELRVVDFLVGESLDQFFRFEQRFRLGKAQLAAATEGARTRSAVNTSKAKFAICKMRG